MRFLICLAICGTAMFDSAATGVAQETNSNANKPVQVFLLVGQSNMQGHARIHTLEHVGMDPATKPIYDKLVNADGSPRTIENVWINSLTPNGIRTGQLTAGFGADKGKLGPELAFGAYIQELTDAPVLLIKASWGGKNIHTDFRPPSAGEFQFSKQQLERFEKQGKDLVEIKAQKKQATGKFYRMTIEHTKSVLANIAETIPGYDASQGYQLAGVVWFQGWNDLVDTGVYPNRGKPGGYDQYSSLLGQFIRDVRNDLESPELPFVIGVLGVHGPADQFRADQKRYRQFYQNFRDAMARPANEAEFRGNVAAVLTEQAWDIELSALRGRQSKIQQQIRQRKRDGQLKRAEERALRESLMTREFSQQELQLIEKGISNQEYHYLGSAKILTRIGQSFAKAMHGLMKQ